MTDLITSVDDERLAPDPNTYYLETEIRLMLSLRIALKRAEAAEAQLRKHNEGWDITEEDVRRIQASDKEIHRAYQVELAAHSSTTRNLREAEAALRSIYGAVGEFADADGKNVVEKIEFLRKDHEQRVANLEEYMLKGVAFRDELQAQLCVAREAIQALLTMMARGGPPRKLDDALSWRQNDELAQEMALDALSSSAPCRHEAELKCLREAVDWALDSHMTEAERTELRRRAKGKEGK